MKKNYFRQARTGDRILILDGNGADSIKGKICTVMGTTHTSLQLKEWGMSYWSATPHHHGRTKLYRVVTFELYLNQIENANTNGN